MVEDEFLTVEFDVAAVDAFWIFAELSNSIEFNQLTNQHRTSI